MDTSVINTAKRVKDARMEAKLTQTELGKKIGKSKQWVSELERGNIKLSFEMAVNISNACNITTEFFCHESPYRKDTRAFPYYRKG